MKTANRFKNTLGADYFRSSVKLSINRLKILKLQRFQNNLKPF